jgi:hypothetical protein
MKVSEFAGVLRKIIREEVTLAVRAELQTLNSNKTTQAQPAKQKLATAPRTRTTPLVSLDEDFRSVGLAPIETGNSMLNQLLTETAHNMANPSTVDPDLPSADTNMFVKDYSAVLKRSEELRG